MKIRSVAPMRAAKIGCITASIIMCVLGIILIAVPDLSASILGIVCGVLLIMFGIVRLIGYFSKDLYRLAFQYDLALGIMLISIGAVMLIMPKSLITFICITFGLFILADSIFKIQTAFEAKRFGISQWWLIICFAFLTGICGIILLFRPGEGGSILMTAFGITLLMEGILNLSTIITAVKIVKNQKSDIEAEYYVESEE